MHTDGYKIRDQNKPHFLTFTVAHWIDVFTRERYRIILMDSMSYCIKNKGMIIHGYVIMSNHMHIIMQSSKGHLSDLIRDFKKHTAKAIIQSIQSETECRREWMLELFSKQFPVMGEVIVTNSGNTATTLKKSLQRNFCGQN